MRGLKRQKGFLGDLIGGVIGYFAGERRNEAQEEQAQQQMDFQERMSGSAHQREVADLRAAGLNPMLSQKYGGASTPPGAQANIENSINSASSAAIARATIANLKEQNDKIQAETELAKAQAAREISQVDVNSAAAGELRERTQSHPQQRMLWSEQSSLWRKQMDLIDAQTHLTKEQKDVARQEVRKIAQAVNTEEMNTRLRHAEAILAELEIPLARNMEGAQGSAFKQNVSPYLLDVMRLFTSGAQARRFGR